MVRLPRTRTNYWEGTAGHGRRPGTRLGGDPGGAHRPEGKRGTGSGGFSGGLKGAKVGGLSATELAELVKVAIAAKTAS